MDFNKLIDAQFEKAVSIVQSLPKTGPIQTGYEEKLAMYSLYKQATVGNVKTPRPGLWDMLGRAKWDAWAKHKDVPPHEAKWLYVQTLLKVLKKYSDKTVAQDLVHELESYGDLDASFAHLFQKQGRMSPTGSSGSESAAATRTGKNLSKSKLANDNPSEEETTTDDDDANDTAGENDATEDEQDEPRPLRSHVDTSFRSPSSLSSHMRYRTPMAGSTISPPPQIPAVQPLPLYSTPSAFGGSGTPPTIPSSASASTYMAGGGYSQAFPYPPHLSHSSIGPSQSPRPPSQQPYNVISQRNSHPLIQNNPDPRTPIERAIENVQAHIAALNERVDMLESVMNARAGQAVGQSSSSLLPRSSHSLFDSSTSSRTWDPSQMGLWSLVIGPLTRITEYLRKILIFLMYVPSDTTNISPRDPRYRLYARTRKFSLSSPVLLVVRRLLLDASFLLMVLGFSRWLWKKTGLRRKNVYVALGVLWKAVVGAESMPKPGRTMVDRGV